jgi:hypothetical protein
VHTEDVAEEEADVGDVEAGRVYVGLGAVSPEILIVGDAVAKHKTDVQGHVDEPGSTRVSAGCAAVFYRESMQSLHSHNGNVLSTNLHYIQRRDVFGPHSVKCF